MSKTNQKSITTAGSRDLRSKLRQLIYSGSPKEIVSRAQDGLFNIEKGSPITPEQNKAMSEALLVMGHEKHFLVAESVVDERWRSMIIDLAEQIQNEYDCKTTSEIALAGLAANAYYRTLRASRKLNAIFEQVEVGHIAMQLAAHAGKEVDRAYRQYLSCIEVLRNRRQPKINVKVQAKAAFFNEHQTINTYQP